MIIKSSNNKTPINTYSFSLSSSPSSSCCSSRLRGLIGSSWGLLSSLFLSSRLTLANRHSTSSSSYNTGVMSQIRCFAMYMYMNIHFYFYILRSEIKTMQHLPHSSTSPGQGSVSWFAWLHPPTQQSLSIWQDQAQSRYAASDIEIVQVS